MPLPFALGFFNVSPASASSFCLLSSRSLQPTHTFRFKQDRKRQRALQGKRFFQPEVTSGKHIQHLTTHREDRHKEHYHHSQQGRLLLLLELSHENVVWYFLLLRVPRLPIRVVSVKNALHTRRQSAESALLPEHGASVLPNLSSSACRTQTLQAQQRSGQPS